MHYFYIIILQPNNSFKYSLFYIATINLSFLNVTCITRKIYLNSQLYHFWIQYYLIIIIFHNNNLQNSFLKILLFNWQILKDHLKYPLVILKYSYILPFNWHINSSWKALTEKSANKTNSCSYLSYELKILIISTIGLLSKY